jgi:secreted trypsin-like serine protease
LQNDIAIIKLSNDVIQSKNVNFVCFNTQVSAQIGDLLTVIGWGHTSSKKEALPARLMQVQLPVLSRNECKLSYDSQNQFCAGDLQLIRDSCNGDSGSPLIKRVSQKWHLVGVVSYGDKDCRGTGVYTNVTVMYDWIKKFI